MNTPDEASVQINYIGGSVGPGANVLQVYAPGAGTLKGERFYSDEKATPFSPEWLMFYQKNVKLIGRKAELVKLRAFVEDGEPFRWWSIHGPAGVGKSRLAYALLEEFRTTWACAFLAPDRVHAGAAATWMPSKDTIWVIDYAAARGRDLGQVLEILARDVHATPYKVRVLLLERDATDASLWLKRLRLDTGHAWNLIAPARFGPSLPLEPIGDKATELLTHLLVAAGRDKAQAAQESALLKPSQLRQVTADGRPLFVALVAAAIVSGSVADLSTLTLPEQLLDAQLGREMRLWNTLAKTQELFDATCRSVFTTTLAAGIDIVRSFERHVFEPRDADAQRRYDKEIAGKREHTLRALQAPSAYADPWKCLQVLELAGITEQTFWAMQPDALGERLIQVLLRRPWDVDQHYSSFPSVSEQHIAAAYEFASRQTKNRMTATLSRLDEDTLGDLLGIVARHTPAPMRDILQAVAEVARIRDVAISHPTLHRLFDAAHFGQRYEEQVGRMLIDWLTVAAAIEPAASASLARLRQDVATDFARIGKWLIPVLIDIERLHDAAMRPIQHVYFAGFRTLADPTSGDLLAAIHVYRNMVNADLEQVSETYAVDRFDGPAVEFSFDDADLDFIADTLDMLQTIERAPREPGDPAMILALGNGLAESAAQASYILLNSAYQRYLAGQPAEDMFAKTVSVADAGVHFSMRTGNRRTKHICERNVLSCMPFTAPDDNYHTARALAFERCRAENTEKEFLELATDACRAAVLRGDIPGFCRIMDDLLQHTSWAGSLIDRFDQEGMYYLPRLDRCLQDGDVRGAFAMIDAYRTLLDTGLAPVSSAHLVDMFSRLASQAARAPDTVRSLCADMMACARTSPDHAVFAATILSTLWVNAHEAGVSVRIDGLDVDTYAIDGATVKRLCGMPPRPSPIDTRTIVIHAFKGTPDSPFAGMAFVHPGGATAFIEWDFVADMLAAHPERLALLLAPAFKVGPA